MKIISAYVLSLWALPFSPRTLGGGGGEYEVLTSRLDMTRIVKRNQMGFSARTRRLFALAASHAK